MGQPELICTKSCGQIQDIGQQSQQFTNWRYKQWSKIDPKYYKFVRQTVKYTGNEPSTAILKELSLVPQEYREVVLNLKMQQLVFTDSVFPHNDISIGFQMQRQGKVVWKRIREVFPHGILTPNRKIKWNHGNKSTRAQKLFCVFSTMSQYDEVMARLLTWPLTEQGIFGVSFFLNGCKQDIIIDDHIPTVDGRYLFGEISQQLWPYLIEKAMAKVAGSYHKINKYTSEELFEQITGIVIDTGKQTSFQSTQEDYHSNDSIEEPLKPIRMPSYNISSHEINCSKRQQYLYYRFSVSEDGQASIRVNQLLPRHMDEIIPIHHKFSDVFIEIGKFQEKDDSLVKMYQGSSRNQKTYVDGHNYVMLKKGDYFVHIRMAQEMNSQFTPPCSLVIYSKNAISIRPIMSISKAESLKYSMLQSFYKKMQSEVMPSAKGKAISTQTITTARRVLLRIRNHEETTKKVKMSILNPELTFEDREGQSDIVLQIREKGFAIVSMFIRQPSAQLDPRQLHYQIKVVN